MRSYFRGTGRRVKSQLPVLRKILEIDWLTGAFSLVVHGNVVALDADGGADFEHVVGRRVAAGPREPRHPVVEAVAASNTVSVMINICSLAIYHEGF